MENLIYDFINNNCKAYVYRNYFYSFSDFKEIEFENFDFNYKYVMFEPILENVNFKPMDNELITLEKFFKFIIPTKEILDFIKKNMISYSDITELQNKTILLTKQINNLEIKYKYLNLENKYYKTKNENLKMKNNALKFNMDILINQIEYLKYNKS